MSPLAQVALIDMSIASLRVRIAALEARRRGAEQIDVRLLPVLGMVCPHCGRDSAAHITIN